MFVICSLSFEACMIVPILHSLKSPVNVGSIVRSHRAFGGTSLVFVGHENPWRFKKSTQAFSRRLERDLDITYLDDDDALLEWCQAQRIASVALEISANATPIDQFVFPDDTALICGNEATGLSPDFLTRCDASIVVPQTGPVSSLNVAIACSIALYSYSRQFGSMQPICNGKFDGGIGD